MNLYCSKIHLPIKYNNVFSAKFSCQPKQRLQRVCGFIFLFSCLVIPSISTSYAEEINSVDNNLKLFGIAVYQEQLNDIYIGVLYAPENITTIQQITDPSVSKRMSLKFLSKYSDRKMVRFWKQRIAMNNSKSKWQPITKSILEFGSLFKRPMQVGDELSILFEPSKGTSIFLNGTSFLTITNINFYEILLNVWIGNIPPTKAFKTGITGKNKKSINEQLTQQYESLQTDIGRFDEDKPRAQMVMPKTAENTTTKNAKQPSDNTKKKKTQSKILATTKKQQKTKPKVEAKDESNAKKTEFSIPSASVPTPPVTTVDIVKPELILVDLIGNNNDLSKKQKNTTDNSKSTSDDLTTTKFVEEQPKNEFPSQKITQISIEKEQIAKLDLPDKELSDSDIYSDIYTKKLINTIRKVQRYPKQAIDLGIEGDVIVLIKIDKNGEVINKALTQRSGSRIIDRAALKMISKAEPFPVIPSELNLEEFEFSVPLSFSFTN